MLKHTIHSITDAQRLLTALAYDQAAEDAWIADMLGSAEAQICAYVAQIYTESIFPRTQED